MNNAVSYEWDFCFIMFVFCDVYSVKTMVMFLQRFMLEEFLIIQPRMIFEVILKAVAP